MLIGYAVNVLTRKIPYHSRKMPIQIRKAIAKDAANIAQFQINMALETESKTLDEQIVQSAVKRVFSDPSKGFYIVASDDDGNPVGSLMITYEWSDWRDTNMWYIQSVYILSDFRRQKLFSRMFDLVMKMAATENAKCVRLYVEEENSIAQNVYESLGMKKMPYVMYDINVD